MANKKEWYMHFIYYISINDNTGVRTECNALVYLEEPTMTAIYRKLRKENKHYDDETLIVKSIQRVDFDL